MRRLVVLGMIASVAAMAPEAVTQSPMFSTRREVVRVDVLVSANGQPVKGLAPADFDVRDNGTRQEVELATFEEVLIDVTLALDMSRSVDGDRLEHLRRAGHSVLSALQPRDRAALVTFSHAVSQRAALTTDRAPVRAALDAATGDGETALIDGVYTSLVLGADQGRSLVIVFSDGVDTRSWLSADALIDTAKRSDAVVYSVATSKDVTDVLDDLSDATGGAVFTVESTSQLDATFLRILNEYRHRYLVSYSPRGVDQAGWHRLDVRVPGRKVTVRARPGYVR
jgi:VWFA-related protein